MALKITRALCDITKRNGCERSNKRGPPHTLQRIKALRAKVANPANPARWWRRTCWGFPQSDLKLKEELELGESGVHGEGKIEEEEEDVRKLRVQE